MVWDGFSRISNSHKTTTKNIWSLGTSRQDLWNPTVQWQIDLFPTQAAWSISVWRIMSSTPARKEETKIIDSQNVLWLLLYKHWSLEQKYKWTTCMSASSTYTMVNTVNEVIQFLVTCLLSVAFAVDPLCTDFQLFFILGTGFGVFALIFQGVLWIL